MGRQAPADRIEWEAAASWDPRRGSQRAFPWGDADATPATANIDQLSFAPRRSARTRATCRRSAATE